MARLMLICLLVCGMSVHHSHQYSFDTSIFDPVSIVRSSFNLGWNTVKTMTELAMSPRKLFEMNKQLLLGLPFEFTATIVNKMCTIALKSPIMPRYEPAFKKVNIVLFTKHGNVSLSLPDAHRLWDAPQFDKQLPTTVFITGWLSSFGYSNDALDTMMGAYQCRGNHNFIVIDTEKFVDTLYTWSSLNTEKLGNFVGKALAYLAVDVPVSSIHVIGHSLGAHISAAAGRSFQKHFNGTLLPRITGLDPANPCFNDGSNLSGLQRGDAQFVDIIHTNNGVFGKKDPIGDVDFYPNGIIPLAKGCLEAVCSHARAWQYYAETVYPGAENNFRARRCSSLDAMQSGACHEDSIAMGIAVPVTAKGNYFLETNAESPFGLNAPPKWRPTNANCVY